MKPLAPCSIGDLADRISILSLKLERITDPDKREHVRAELTALKTVWYESVNATGPGVMEVLAKLDKVNERLWDLEDRARSPILTRDGVKDSDYILAAITETNDRRAEFKRSLNLLLGSEIVEEKSYR